MFACCLYLHLSHAAAQEVDSLIRNGGFSNTVAVGDWVRTGNFFADSRFANCKSCPGYAYHSNTNGQPAVSILGSLQQLVAVRSTAVSNYFLFFYRISSEETNTSARDTLSITLETIAGTVITNLGTLSNLNASQDYRQFSASLIPYANQVLFLVFRASNNATAPTVFRLDDVSLRSFNKPTISSINSAQQFCFENVAQVALDWSLAENVTSYSVLREDLTLPIASDLLPTQSGYIDKANLEGGKTYGYRVVAKNSYGSTTSSTVRATLNSTFCPPQTPTALAALATPNVVSLAWSDQSINEQGFYLQRKVAGTAEWSGLAVLAANAGAYLDYSTDPEITYSYRVAAFNSTGTSPFSNERSATRPKRTFTITINPAPNGTTTPSGQFQILERSTLTITASPDPNYQLKQWMLNGVIVPVDNGSLSLSEIKEDHIIEPKFEPVTYTLSVRADNADVSIVPRLSRYPHGSSVTISVTPNPGFAFRQWRDGFSSLQSEITIIMFQSWNLRALMTALAPDPFAIAGTTVQQLPSRPIELSIPTDPGYQYIVWKSEDLEHIFWRPLKSWEATLRTLRFEQFLTSETREGQFLLQRRLAYSMTPFLQFPLKDVNASDARVSTIMDHQLSRSGITPSMLTHRGHLVTKWDKMQYADGLNASILLNLDKRSDYFWERYWSRQSIHWAIAFSRADDTEFLLDMNYTDSNERKSELSYPGHAGYDYPGTTNTLIYAVADGLLNLEKMSTDNGVRNNQITLDHQVKGYRSYYLHLSRWTPAIQTAFLKGDKSYFIKQGTCIGYMGNTGDATGVHLHFELHRKHSDEPNSPSSYTPVDPYGFFAIDGSIIDPLLWDIGALTYTCE